MARTKGNGQRIWKGERDPETGLPAEVQYQYGYPITPTNHPNTLSFQQLKFVDEFMACLNVTEASRRAGYAEEYGYRLIKMEKIQIALYNARQAMNRRSHITKERILTEYAKLAFQDPRLFYNDDGTLKHITELGDFEAGSIASLEIEELFAGRGEDRVQIGVLKKIKFHDKKGPLRDLAEMYGLFPDKTNDKIAAPGSGGVMITGGQQIIKVYMPDNGRGDRELVEGLSD